MAPNTKTRRRFLQLAGATTAIGLAGCSTGASDPEDGAESAPGTSTTTVRTTPTRTEADDDHSEGHGEEGHHDEETGTHATEEDHEDGHAEDDGHHDEETETHATEDEHDDGHDQDDGHHDEETDTHVTEDDHDDHSHGGEVGDPVDHAEVRMITTEKGDHFDPHVVRLEPGGTVTFHNESGAHSATAYHPENGKPQRVPDGTDAWDTGTLAEAGASVDVTFDTEGVYDYYCIPHESVGMIGSVIVGEPDPHDQPGLAEPSSDLPEGARSKISALNERVNEALGHTH